MNKHEMMGLAEAAIRRQKDRLQAGYYLVVRDGEILCVFNTATRLDDRLIYAMTRRDLTKGMTCLQWRQIEKKLFKIHEDLKL